MAPIKEVETPQKYTLVTDSMSKDPVTMEPISGTVESTVVEPKSTEEYVKEIGAAKYQEGDFESIISLEDYQQALLAVYNMSADATEEEQYREFKKYINSAMTPETAATVTGPLRADSLFLTKKDMMQYKK